MISKVFWLNDDIEIWTSDGAPLPVTRQGPSQPELAPEERNHKESVPRLFTISSRTYVSSSIGVLTMTIYLLLGTGRPEHQREPMNFSH